MNRMAIVFVAGLFFTLGLNFSNYDDSRNITTVQNLVPQVEVNLDKVESYFTADHWLNEKLSTEKIDINAFYQKTVFKRKLANDGKKEIQKVTYNTWIEKRECIDSPHMDRPVRARMTSRYGWRTHPLSGRRHIHAGIDFRGKKGTPVIAAANGFVKSVSRKGAYGKAIIIGHGNDYTTLYGHLSSYAVEAGDWVNQGQTIGYIGRTGRATGPHLHFEVRCHNVPMNPLAYLGKSNQVAKVRFRRRARIRPFYAGTNSAPRPVKRDPNYYTRLINLRKLHQMQKRVQ